MKLEKARKIAKNLERIGREAAEHAPISVILTRIVYGDPFFWLCNLYPLEDRNGTQDKENIAKRISNAHLGLRYAKIMGRSDIWVSLEQLSHTDEIPKIVERISTRSFG